METKEERKNKALEDSIRQLLNLYEKSRRFLNEEDKIELTNKVENLRNFLMDLIW
jgi:hypothetical protein